MTYQFKYGLKNAHILLNQLKNRSSSPDQQQQDNTFIQQSSAENEDNNTNQCPLANMIIFQHLKSTLKMYKSDLQTMINNRDNYVEGIELLVQKIHNLTEIKTKNEQLAIQNQHLKNTLLSKIQQYHEKCKELNTLQIHINGQIAKTNNKVKIILEYIQQDKFYDGYINQWLQYLKYQSNQKKKMQNIQYDQKKIIDNLLGEKKEHIEQAKKNVQIDLKKQGPKEESVRTSLVSNLKEFSKNFRVPK